MSESSEYLLVQYMQDPMRREPQNFGVIVTKGRDVAALFYGQRSPDSDIDGRTIRFMPHPSVYKKWVQYWQQEIAKGTEELKQRLMAHNGGNYNVIDGGFVTDTGTDSAAVLCDYLYGVLVASVAERTTERFDASVLHSEVTKEFRDRNIIGIRDPNVFHPILTDRPLLGKRATHTPAYFQGNGDWWVMDAVNFMTPKKNPAKDHAGWMVTMFDDLRAKYPDVTKPIAIIRADEDTLDDDVVKYAMDLLRGSAVQLVNWANQDERDAFVDERETIARSAMP